MLVGVNMAQAAGWNQYPGDCPAINIGNYSTGQGINPGSCWNLTSVSATGGQIINVKIFYDNTNGVAANNTNISLTKSPSGASTNFSFSGNLTSSAGNLPFSQVTANIATSETLTFNQAKWYQNGSSSPVSFPSGQTGSEAFSGGLSLGTIPNNDWGAIVFSFNVSSTQQSICTISNFTANGSQTANISTGQSVNLVWNTTGCTSVTVTGSNYNNNALTGNQTIYPTTSGTYTISAFGPNGAVPTQTVSVNITNTQSNCYINSFTANGSSNNVYIQMNSPVYIVWSTTGCTSATASGLGLYSNQLSGSQTIYPSYSGNVNLNAYGSNGNPTQTIYINVGNNNYQTCQDPNATNYGGALPCNYYNQYNNCYINSFTANGSNSVNINSGQAVTLAWNTNNCTSVSIAGVGSNLPASYSQIVYPTYTTTYVMNAYGTYGGNASRSVSANVNNVIYPPIYSNTCAVTTVATNVTKNSAQLNGLVTNNNQNSNAYFEYGTTVGLGSRTNARSTNGSFNEIISGLTEDTIYYFRSVADCSGGTSRGKIEIFSTLAEKVIRPVIIQGTTVVGTRSPIMLKIEDRYQSIGVGDIVDYTVTYKNISKLLLSDPVVQVVVPRGITVINSSAGTYSTDTNTLTVPLENLKPGDEGVIYVQGRVDSISSNVAQIVTTAILVYTAPNSAQENAIAYVLNSPREIVPVVKADTNGLGAAAFFAGIFPTTLLGWLLLIALILAIILATRKYGSKSVVRTTSPTGNHTTTTTSY